MIGRHLFWVLLQKKFMQTLNLVADGHSKDVCWSLSMESLHLDFYLRSYLFPLNISKSPFIFHLNNSVIYWLLLFFLIGSIYNILRNLLYFRRTWQMILVGMSFLEWFWRWGLWLWEFLLVAIEIHCAITKPRIYFYSIIHINFFFYNWFNL